MGNSSSRVEAYIQGSQDEVIAAAEAKLQRPLTPREQAGVKRIRSTMMLEFIYMNCTHQDTTPDFVASEIAFFQKDLESEQGESKT